jgi:hypothetical protein
MDYLYVFLGLIGAGLISWGPWILAAWIFDKVMDS